MGTMRAIQVRENGGPEVLTVAELPAPEPGPGEVLVDVEAAGINYIDTYRRSGAYPVTTPFVPGNEGAGTVRAVGADVSGFAVGDRVGWTNTLGSYAEQVAVPSDEALPIPDGLDTETAAAVLLQGMTAHYLATSTYPVGDGDWALVHAAAGGVGLLLTQIVKLRGGRVLGTTSTAEKAGLARAAGADEVASYDDFADRARELTGGEGFPVVYDGVGRATFDRGLQALRPRGLMVLYGAASGPVPPIDLQVLNPAGSLFVTRPTLAHYTRTREELRSRSDELFGWIRDGRLDVRVGGRYALGDAGQAHADLEGRRTTGKLLVLPH